MSDDPYLYVRQARPDLYQEIVAFSSTVNLQDELQARASIEKFCMHLVDACKYALVILLSLLFAGVVEAGDLLNTLKLKKVVKDGGDTLVTCNDELTACWTPCEVRMREVMKTMDEYLDQRGDFIPPRDLEMAYARREAAVKLFDKWHDVMKECAK